MIIVVIGLGLILAGGITSAVTGRWPRVASLAAVVGIVSGSLCGLIGTGQVLAGGGAPALKLPWQVPGGSLSLAVDPLSAWFLLPLFLLAPAAAVYGLGYLTHGHGGRAPGGVWPLTCLLVAAMATVFVARNAVLFLVAWEVMSLAAYFLVAVDHRRAEVREAGWTYLVATHLGTAFLIAMFLVMGRVGGTLELDELRLDGVAPGLAGSLFVLSLIGFGTKAGLAPFHVWLPEAHPAAPSHISALMSGVMISTGTYGLVRVLLLLPSPAVWWGWALLAVGALTGVGGVLFAVAQQDLKRLLAYSSVENSGVIAIGLGLGVLGADAGNSMVAVAGFGGALFHVLNHALFKGLLFLGAGAAVQAVGSRDLDRMGGLAKRMPWTAGSFAVGAAAISGLPPFNGFVSELLIFVAAFAAVLGGGGGMVAAGMLGATALGLIAGLAVACFSKAFGAAFLGEARRPEAAAAVEVGRGMIWPMAALAVGCAAIGLGGPWALAGIGRVVDQAVGSLGVAAPEVELATLSTVLVRASLAGIALVAAVAAAALLRRLLLRGREVAEDATWGCGYAAPTARMQYTGSSFAEPLVRGFSPVLRSEVRETPPVGLYPKAASLVTATPDVLERHVYRPAFAFAGELLGRMRWLQQGRVQLYLLYLVATLLALLLWTVR